MKSNHHVFPGVGVERYVNWIFLVCLLGLDQFLKNNFYSVSFKPSQPWLIPLKGFKADGRISDNWLTRFTVATHSITCEASQLLCY